MLEQVLTELRACGHTVERPDDAGEPTALATGGSGPLDFAAEPVAVERVGSDPTTLVERAADAARSDRATLYVTSADEATTVGDILSTPRFVADERDGFRQFYPVPDRIQLADGSYAAVRATQPTARYGESARARADRVLTWREAPGDDDPSLVLDVNRQSTVTLDSVASLTNPGPASVFPYRYTRRDGSFRVLQGDEEVGRFASIGAMRERGYQPVPVPLVPEHHLRWGTPTLGLAVVDGEQVHYERITKQEQ
ncbi:hypothetical protein [Halosegnis longus]|uniref:hypothetical protein n=1 Tax=Halosegnis longus TaxID=2216012 RepID=UPI00129E7681|nr:hypothetical protein [Halosegnis longus]